MAQYIDKSALVAEIDKITKALYRQNPDEFGDETQFLAAAEIGTLNLVKDIIDTLEVKEPNSTDAFIKKAVEWLKSNLYDYAGEDDMGSIVPFDSSIFEDFKNYMKGE